MRILTTRRVLIYAALCTCLASPARSQDWPQWRGPQANGVSPEVLPVHWSASRNMAWRVPLAGRGMSTPIIWNGRVYVTSQIGFGKVEASSARYDGPPLADQVEPILVLQCFRADDGKLLWERRIPVEEPLPAVHAFHNLASPSPVTDGQRLYVWFGSGQLVTYTLDGDVVWSRNLGREVSPFDPHWGHGSSPVLHRDLLILLCDHATSAHLLALDKATGEEVWKVQRGEGLRSYATPLLMEVGDHYELIVNSNPRIDAYDPDTGRLLWFTGEHCRAPIPSAFSAGGVIYTSRGYNSGPYMAIRPGGRGDITRTHLLWRIPTGAPYVSSLLHYQDRLYMATEVGVVRSINPATGETLWTRRMGGNFTASPLGAGGRIYLLSEDCETVVLDAQNEGHILARNTLDGVCRASPAVSGGRIFIRSEKTLYAIGATDGDN